jgi:hypothetical protein
MNKNCTHCKSEFLDNTKNSNRIHCGSLACRKVQCCVYRLNRDQQKYNVNQARFKALNPNYLKDWRDSNKERDRQLNRKYVVTRYNSDVEYKLRMRLRNRLYSAVKGKSKAGSAVKDLGCSIEEFKIYLESKFELGMTWDNYGKWEIDHIKPLVMFKLENREDLLLACNYTNLQPMCKQLNRRKGAKYAI